MLKCGLASCEWNADRIDYTVCTMGLCDKISLATILERIQEVPVICPKLNELTMAAAMVAMRDMASRKQ